MKLLEVYSYRNQNIYKFIYISEYNNYFWYYKNEVAKAQTSIEDTRYKRVLRKTYDFT